MMIRLPSLPATMPCMSLLASVLMPFVLMACSPQTESAASATPASDVRATHPESGLSVIPVTIRRADGSTHVIAAEYALDDADQGRGLMFRTQMGADEGMLFDYEDDPHLLNFWMKNTVIPLDLIFIDPQRRVLNIAANAEPYSEERIPSAGVAGAVLELNGGRAAQLGIAPGDTISW